MCELRINFTEWVAEREGVLGNEKIEVDENGNIIKDGAVVFDENGRPVSIDHTSWEQTASGGGTRELADGMTGFFTEAEVMEVKIDGK
jgi:hypothetical protein